MPEKRTAEQREAEEAVAKEVLAFVTQEDGPATFEDWKRGYRKAAVRREVEIKRLQSLLAERDKEVGTLAKTKLEEVQRMLRSNEIVFKRDLSKVLDKSDEAAWWEKVAFSIYVDLVDFIQKIEHLIEKD